MKSHLFIEILKTLSRQELYKLRDFIASPYFNKKERLVKFYDLIMKYYPSFDDECLTKETLYRKLYPGKKYSDSTIRDTLSDLFRLSKEFLIYKNIKYYKTETTDVFLKECTNRNLQHLFRKSIIEFDDGLEEDKIDSKFFLRKYKLESNKYNFNVINHKFIKVKNVLEQFDQIKNAELYFLLYFILDFISDYVKVFAFSMSYNIGQKVNIYEEVIENIDLEKINRTLKGRIEYDYILSLYIKMLYAFNHYENDQYYYEYKTNLIKISNKLSRNELTFHYSNLINFCVLKRMKCSNEEKYEAELFEIYKIVLKEGYFKDSITEYLDKTLYRNILFLALRLKEHDWVKYFIENYSSLLHKKDRKNMTNYSNIYLYNDLGEYQRSLDYLNKINIDYFIYKYDVNNIKVKLYYELKNYESALDLIHTCNQYIRNDAILESSKKSGHKNFLRFAQQLFLHRLGKDDIDLGFMKKKILKTENTFHKRWLIEKIEEIE